MGNAAELRIIVIDDNAAIHRDFLKILTTESADKLDLLDKELFNEAPANPIQLPKFIIDTASQGKEGVERIRQALQENRPYALAFVDIRMPPGWDGIETIKHIWELDKDIQIVICTAYSDYTWEQTVANLGQTDNLLILKKPFDNVAVRQLACALTKKWQLLQASRQYTNSLEAEVEDRTLSLQKSLSLIKATLESSNDGILVTNNEGSIIDHNQKIIDMMQIPNELIESQSEKSVFNYIYNQLINPTHFIRKVSELEANKEEVSVDIIQFKNGKIFECYSQPNRLNDKNIGRVYDFRDVTKRIKLENDLHFQATHDSLTGLPNRVMLLEAIQKEIKKSDKDQLHFAVLFFDLDRFKLVNDSLSHATGDEVLKAVAERLCHYVRAEDSLARLGGDEFVLLLSNVSNHHSLVARIKKLMHIFSKPLTIEQRNITISLSIGVAVYPETGKTAEMLLRNADAAMYSAKERGGNNFQFYSAKMNLQNIERLEKEEQLRNALQNEEFFLVYQPQVDIENENLVAVEALLRWKHPTKGVVLPIDFIPLAEEIGLIAAIGEWVLRQACLQNKMWQENGLPPIRMAVNITNQQLRYHNLVSIVKSILTETGLDPKYLELELTENVIITNLKIMHTISKLKELGVSIAIDDFGAGYSSLTYLDKLPLDRLKIDSAYIKHIQSEVDDEVIIRAVLSIAKSLNLEVVAEGVETKNQLEFLKKNKCLDVQGFYFSKPLTKTELENYLRNPMNEKIISKLQV